VNAGMSTIVEDNSNTQKDKVDY